MTYNLQPTYSSSEALTTNDRALVVLYGRRPSDGALIPVNIDSSGSVTTNTTVSVTITSLTTDHDHYVGLGQGFGVVYESAVAGTAATDNPLLLINNPVASGKSIYLHALSIGVIDPNKSCTFELYANPTVTANGTAITPQNSLIGNATASITTSYKLPTVSARGNLIRGYVAGQNTNSAFVSVSLIVAPGNSLLLTGNPSTSNTTVEAQITWSER